jgi:hypothetical protein
MIAALAVVPSARKEKSTTSTCIYMTITSQDLNTLTDDIQKA